MTSDTVRQLFLYNVPVFDNGIPMIRLGEFSIDEKCNWINMTELCKMNKHKFSNVINSLIKNKVKNIVIRNDIKLINNNEIISNAINYDLLAFAYWFQKCGFKVEIS